MCHRKLPAGLHNGLCAACAIRELPDVETIEREVYAMFPELKGYKPSTTYPKPK